MPIYEIKRLQRIGNPEMKMSIQLALHGAPIIRGIKMANLLTVTRKEIASVGKILRGTNISYKILKAEKDRVILFLYRVKELEAYLFSQHVQQFLQTYGYQENNLKQMLSHLSDRIRMHKNGQTEFPHEIGVFLGYPLEDVIGFVENDGENFSYVGYWKVYHDVQGALNLFRQYDEERERVVQEVILGKTIREIAV